MFRKTQTMSIKEFMNYKKTEVNKGKIYKTLLVTGITAVTLFSGFDISFAAESGIDEAARSIYDKLLLVGKWIIIIKGGIDTVNSVVQGDVGGAKRNFLGYLVVYLILNGLPWAMDQVDQVFKQI